MAAKKRYYLVVRYLNDNSYSILTFTDRNGTKNRESRLDRIDFLTCHYRNKQEFIYDLRSQDYISSSDVDLFIVCPNDKEKKLEYYEIVYNTENELMNKFREVTVASLDKNMTSKEDNIKYILDRFATLMNNDEEFNNIVTFGFSNVANKYMLYFKNHHSVKPYYNAKFNHGGWALGSYSLIRNIVDIMNRYDQYKKYTENTFEANLDYYNEVTPGRKVVSKEILNEEYRIYFNSATEARKDIKRGLLQKTDKNYSESQITFDEYLKELEFDDETVENTDTSSFGVDVDTKISAVIEEFSKLPNKTFSVLEDKTTVINENMFLAYQSEKDKELLTSLLPKDLVRDLDSYVANISKYKMYSSRVQNTNDLVNEINYYEMKIYKRLSENIDELNNAYSWCLLYNRCMEYDLDYRKKLGEDNGKVYDKYSKYKNEGN